MGIIYLPTGLPDFFHQQYQYLWVLPLAQGGKYQFLGWCISYEHLISLHLATGILGISQVIYLLIHDKKQLASKIHSLRAKINDQWKQLRCQTNPLFVWNQGSWAMIHGSSPMNHTWIFPTRSWLPPTTIIFQHHGQSRKQRNSSTGSAVLMTSCFLDILFLWLVNQPLKYPPEIRPY